jgi:hypothetical protein
MTTAAVKTTCLNSWNRPEPVAATDLPMTATLAASR